MSEDDKNIPEDKVYESAEELYHDAPCGYLSFNRDGVIYNLNKTLENWLGYSRKEIIGKLRIQDLFKIGGKIYFETHFFPLIRIQGFANEINFEIKKKDKSTFPALINVKEIKGQTVNDNRYRASIFDISDRKRYEQELINSKIKAEEISKAKADFLATISHEIRTPLNAILGIGDLLAKTPLNAKQKEYSDILRHSSDNLLSLINNLLDLSKMQAKDVKLEEKPFSVRRLSESLIHTFEIKCKEKGIKLSAEIDDAIPTYISGDPIKLNQILTNLLGNAIKFTCKGHVKLKVSLIEIEDKRLSLHFEVEDTGMGIPEDKLQSIFKEFSQASYDVNLKFGGTGLGLSITQKLLQLHQSEIKVESKLGKGSVFRFKIDYEVYDSASPESEELLKNIDPKILKSAKVLVVEDNPVNIFVISEYLCDWNLYFDTAENGKQAIEAVKKRNYDVILMDLHMPLMNGFEAASIIRNLDLKFQPAILALSATSRENIQSKLQQAGFNDFISKPFGPKDLQKVLSLYLQKKHEPDFKPHLAEVKKTKETPTPKKGRNNDPVSFDLSRVVKMASNKPEFLSKFVVNTAKSFEDYKKDFQNAICDKEASKISDLIHKSTMSVYYIQSDKLVGYIRDCQDSLEKEELNSPGFQKKVDKALSEFDLIIRGLKKLQVEDLLATNEH